MHFDGLLPRNAYVFPSLSFADEGQGVGDEIRVTSNRPWLMSNYNGRRATIEPTAQFLFSLSEESKMTMLNYSDKLYGKAYAKP